MRFGSWKGSSFSSALVDSALAGSQDDASLFWTSASFWAKTEDADGEEEPEGQDDPLGHGAGEPAGDLSMHGAKPLNLRPCGASGFSLRDP